MHFIKRFATNISLTCIKLPIILYSQATFNQYEAMYLNLQVHLKRVISHNAAWCTMIHACLYPSHDVVSVCLMRSIRCLLAIGVCEVSGLGIVCKIMRTAAYQLALGWHQENHVMGNWKSAACGWFRIRWQRQGPYRKGFPFKCR